MALQVALLTAIEGTGPAGPLGFGLEADVFLSVVHGLAVPLAWPLASEEAMTAALVRDLVHARRAARHRGAWVFSVTSQPDPCVASLAQLDRERRFPPGNARRRLTSHRCSCSSRGIARCYGERRQRGVPPSRRSCWSTHAVEDGIRRNAAEATPRQDAAWARREAAWTRDAAKRAAAELGETG